jgi:periplasmic protein TonB
MGLLEDLMFADSLLESSPQLGHRPAWTKLASMLLQSLGLALALAIPLFHIEHLQIVPPPPSIRMTNVQPAPVEAIRSTAASSSSQPILQSEMIEPQFFPRHPAQITDQGSGPEAVQLGPPCTGNCITGPITNLISAGPRIIPPSRPPARPPHISQMQLGELVRKVLPEYPIIAKQLHVQGAVVLMATVGKDGHVHGVQPLSGPPLLVQPAMRAVEQWQYHPYRLNQEPVEVQTQITVNFVLNQQ